MAEKKDKKIRKRVDRKPIKLNIQDAVLMEDNSIRCSCGSDLGNIHGDVPVKVVIHNGKKYTQFARRCNKITCDIVSRYQKESSLNDNTIYVFPQEELEEVKEDKVIIQEKEE